MPNNVGPVFFKDYLVVGGRMITRLSNLITLKGQSDASVSDNTTLRPIAGPDVGYQVPASYQLRIFAVRVMVYTVAAAGIAKLLYSDNDMGVVGSTAPTNAVYLGGSPGGTDGFCHLSVLGMHERDLGSGFVVPAAKYPGIISNISAAVWDATVYGYLEAV